MRESERGRETLDGYDPSLTRSFALGAIRVQLKRGGERNLHVDHQREALPRGRRRLHRRCRLRPRASAPGRHHARDVASVTPLAGANEHNMESTKTWLPPRLPFHA